MNSGEAIEVFQTLASLYVSMDIANESPETFAGEVIHTIRESKDPEFHLEEGKWDDFRQYLAEILSLDATLGVSAKASELKTEYANVFCTARIITDLRPVYGRDVLKGPTSAVVVHEARITYHEDGADATKDFYVVLDSEDIQQLRKLLARAVNKERSLKSVARKGELNVLES